VTPPSVTYHLDPQYSDEARTMKYSGTVLLSIVVDTQGRARSVQIVRGLGLGLDEKAALAVENWVFRPGMKDGHPVNARAQIEVNFRLL
jgi:protein TonB